MLKTQFSYNQFALNLKRNFAKNDLINFSIIYTMIFSSNKSYD